MRIFLERTSVVFCDQSVEHDRAETATRHSADGENVSGEVWIGVLKSTQNNPGPISGPDSTAFRCYDVEGMWLRKFLHQRVPLFKSGNDAVALHRARWKGANAMVVIPQTENNREYS